MYLQLRQFLSSIGLLLGFAVIQLNAGLVTYYVDFSGTDNVTGNRMRLYGGLTVDPDLPISATSYSNLLFQRNSEPPAALRSVPQVSGGASSNLKWEVIGGNLHIVRTGQDNEFISWDVPIMLGRPKPQLLLGSGTHAHYFRFDTPPIILTEWVILKGASGPDGPIGFFVGTPIPEPSSAWLLAEFGTTLPLLRRRRG